MIKTIGFDLGGVYLTDALGKKGWESISQTFNIDNPREKFRKRYREYMNVVNVGKRDIDDLLKDLLPPGYKDIEKIKQHIKKIQKVLYPETLEIINQLKNNYQVVLMNNEGSEWNDFRIKEFHLDKIFDKLLSSCIIGEKKPDKNYFKKALKILKIRPEEFLFIDNTLKNVESAKELGIQTIWFKNPAQLKRELLRKGISF